MSTESVSAPAGSRFEELRNAAVVLDVSGAQAAATAIQREFVPVHDGFMDASAAILSRLVDLTSPETGEEIGRRAMKEHMAGPWFDQYVGRHAPAPEELRERIRMIVATWHWHPGRFTLTEDEKRVTLHAHPCGSGMRLELRGKYDGPSAWHRSVKPSGSTFMETGFPMYCNHCPEMNREGLERGATTWLVEGWRPYRAPERHACRQHSYKRLEDVPAEFYRRVGLEPPAEPRQASPGDPGLARLFSEEELAYLATHPAERVVLACKEGDADRALALVDECEAGWKGMHGAYPIWVSLLWRAVRDRFGVDEFRETVVHTAPELVANVSESDRSWTAFWSMHFALRRTEIRSDATVLEFDPGCLTDPGTTPLSPAELIQLLNDGLARRGWDHVGTFESKGDYALHYLPATRISKSDS